MGIFSTIKKNKFAFVNALALLLLGVSLVKIVLLYQDTQILIEGLYSGFPVFWNYPKQLDVLLGTITTFLAITLSLQLSFFVDKSKFFKKLSGISVSQILQDAVSNLSRDIFKMTLLFTLAPMVLPPFSVGLGVSSALFFLSIGFWFRVKRGGQSLSWYVHYTKMLLVIPLICSLILLLPRHGLELSTYGVAVILLSVTTLTVSFVSNIFRFRFLRLSFYLLSFSVLLLGIRGYFFQNQFQILVSTDDYHFGEHVLPYWQWKYFNDVPYVDLVPAHGLINMLPAFSADLFLSELSPLSITYMQDVFSIVILVVSFILLVKLSNSIFLPWISLALFPPGMMRIGYLPFFVLFCCMFYSRLWKNSFLWLSVYIVLAPFLALYVLSYGSIWIISLAPVALLQLVKAIKQYASNQYDKGSLLVFIITFLSVLTTTIFLSSFFQAVISTLLENGNTNLISYGIPLLASIPDGLEIAAIFELIRFSWFLYPAVMVSLLYLHRSNSRQTRLSWFLIATTIYLLLLQPYTLGRIDIQSISRAGLVSALTWSVFAVFVVSQLLTNHLKKIIGLCVITPVFLLGIKYSNYEDIFSPPSNEDIVAANKHKQGISQIKMFTDQFLTDSDFHFLNLSNRNMLNYYLEQPTALQSGAYYNMPSEDQQQEAISRLEDYHPTFVYLGTSDDILDGQPLSLRSYFIYRWLIDNEYVFRYDPELQGVYALSNAIVVNFKTTTAASESSQAKIAEVITPENLDSLPIVWGRSWHNLDTKPKLIYSITNDEVECNQDCTVAFSELGQVQITITGGSPKILVASERIASLSTAEVQLLYFKASVFNTTIIRGQINAGPIFNISTSPHLVPLDLNPAWYENSFPSEIQINLYDLRPGDELIIENLSLFNRAVE